MMRRDGFTLIELMIVMAVIAILLGIILPSFKGIRDEASISRAQGDLHTLQIAVESFYIHNSNTLPGGLATLIDETPRIVSSIPNDPFNPGSSYSYYEDTNNVYYVIFSLGPDRTADITGITTAGAVSGGPDDDVFVTNGTSVYTP